MADGDLVMRLACAAGFQSVSRVPTKGQPDMFAMASAGARRSVGLYFMFAVKMYDVKRSNQPTSRVIFAALLDRPGFSQC